MPPLEGSRPPLGKILDPPLVSGGVGTFKPYLVQKNLFELFALTGGRHVKTSGTRAHAQEPPL